MKSYKAKTVCEIQDLDWKTAAALGIKPIPKGAIVEVIGKLSNRRGTYTKVKYNGYVYYTDGKNLTNI